MYHLLQLSYFLYRQYQSSHNFLQIFRIIVFPQLIVMSSSCGCFRYSQPIIKKQQKSSQCQLRVETLQRAFTYVDITLSSIQTPSDALYLIGISSLLIAAKLDESRNLSQQMELEIMNNFAMFLKMDPMNTISSGEIIKCESVILQFCCWRPLVPCATEILKLILFVCNSSQDFTDIIEKTNELIFSALLSYEMCCFRYSSIALSSLMLVLEQYDFQQFQDGMMSLIEEHKIPFDIAQVEQCKEAIIHLLTSEEASQQQGEIMPQPLNVTEIPLEQYQLDQNSLANQQLSQIISTQFETQHIKTPAKQQQMTEEQDFSVKETQESENSSFKFDLNTTSFLENMQQEQFSSFLEESDFDNEESKDSKKTKNIKKLKRKGSLKKNKLSFRKATRQLVYTNPISSSHQPINFTETEQNGMINTDNTENMMMIELGQNHRAGRQSSDHFVSLAYLYNNQNHGLGETDISNKVSTDLLLDQWIQEQIRNEDSNTSNKRVNHFSSSLQ
ncbi:UNKNOWN [Stylonychia lemnae]|uniref:Cyclin N-terminal domain-containing protein n=1 Tax=Stylonychia lemnae TaxID=5949 RepID=A0A078AY73_STYLE|nr:UNKNOWN [Stylonychia lemnae]|eukprot:CDW87119.1 UNKNOWN [Stylonychia lemnae]